VIATFAIWTTVKLEFDGIKDRNSTSNAKGFRYFSTTASLWSYNKQKEKGRKAKRTLVILYCRQEEAALFCQTIIYAL